MKKRLATLAGAGLIAASAPAWAEHPSGGYLGFSIGQMRADACGSAPSGFRCDGSDTSARFFGGYQFTPYLAGEIGGSLLGSISAATGESADLSALDLSAVGSWPLGNRFTVFGRLGVYSGSTRMKGDSALPVPLGAPQPRAGWKDGSNDDLTYGLGASYAFSHNGSFRVDWQRFRNFGTGDSHQFDVDAFWLAGLYRFR
ncbi:MAG TPA: outer membrane beta-barrel protein [Burkholderiales bacterium]